MGCRLECNYKVNSADDVIFEIPFTMNVNGNIGYIHGPKCDLSSDGFADKGNGADTAATRRFTGKRKGIGAVDEVSVNDDGSLRYIRRHNGDQSHQGRHARISVDDYKILRVTLYEY